MDLVLTDKIRIMPNKDISDDSYTHTINISLTKTYPINSSTMNVLQCRYLKNHRY